MKSFRPGFWAVLLLTAGCALSPRPQLPDSDPAGRAQRLQAVSGWYCAGRFSFKGPNDTLSGRFEWYWSPDSENLLLSDPLGKGVARISRGPQGARILDARGEVHEGADIAELITRLAGATVPVRTLRYWLLGVPAPEGAAAVRRGSTGLPETIEQAGWKIRLSRYEGWVGQMLPARLQAEGDSGVSLRLVISEWRLDDPA